MSEWIEVGFESAFSDGKARRVDVLGQPVLVLMSAEGLYAIGNQCTHQGAALDRGVVKIAGSVRTVTCPAHGSMFDLGTGRVVRPPATKPVPAYDVKVKDGRVFLRLKTQGKA